MNKEQFTKARKRVMDIQHFSQSYLVKKINMENTSKKIKRKPNDVDETKTKIQKKDEPLLQ